MFLESFQLHQSSFFHFTPSNIFIHSFDASKLNLLLPFQSFTLEMMGVCVCVEKV
jgi:hypothetical protein